MKFHCQVEKTDNGLVLRPMYSSDQEQLAKLKQNTPYNAEFKQDRNYEFHKKFMALINLGYENQERYDNFEHYRKLTIMEAGYYDTIITDKGTIYLPQSISFSSMDNIEFEQVFSDVLDVVSKQLDSSPLLIKEQLEDFYGDNNKKEQGW